MPHTLTPARAPAHHEPVGCGLERRSEEGSQGLGSRAGGQAGSKVERRRGPEVESRVGRGSGG
eukprot:2823012-Rhodomonas_salina.1